MLHSTNKSYAWFFEGKNSFGFVTYVGEQYHAIASTPNPPPNHYKEAAFNELSDAEEWLEMLDKKASEE